MVEGLVCEKGVYVLDIPGFESWLYHSLFDHEWVIMMIKNGKNKLLGELNNVFCT